MKLGRLPVRLVVLVGAAVTAALLTSWRIVQARFDLIAEASIAYYVQFLIDREPEYEDIGPVEQLSFDPTGDDLQFVSRMGLAGRLDPDAIDLSSLNKSVTIQVLDLTSASPSTEIQEPFRILETDCIIAYDQSGVPAPADAGTCDIVVDKFDCEIALVNEEARSIRRLGGGACEATNPVGQPLSELKLRSIDAIGITRDRKLLIGTCEQPRIYAIDLTNAAAVVEVFAGDGTSGFAGDHGPAVNAKLRCPTGLIVEEPVSARDGGVLAAGGVRFADRSNNRIRRVSASGVITTVAGGSFPATGNGDGGPATEARLRSPECVTLGSDGAMYICDTLASTVRRVDGTTSVITTFAGNGMSGRGIDGAIATETPLFFPGSLALDHHGNLFIAEGGRLSMVRASIGDYQIVLGPRSPTGADGKLGDGSPGRATPLFNVLGLAVVATPADPSRPDSPAAAVQQLIYTDYGRNRVRSYDPIADRVTTIAGTGAFPADTASLNEGGLAVDAAMGNPWGLALASGNKLIVSEGCRIRQIDLTTGIITTLVGTNGFTVADCTYGGDGGPGNLATLNQPTGVAVDGLDNVYWTEQGSSTLRMLTRSTGLVTTLAGTGTPGYGGDGGPASLAQLRAPFDVDVDASGMNVYLTDTSNHAIRRIDRSQNPPTISAMVGQGSAGFGGDGGPPAAALLNNPYSSTLINGFLYVVDTGNDRIRQVGPLTGGAPMITTVAGNGTRGRQGIGGNALAARLFGPSNLAAGPNGEMYASEYFGGRILKLSQAPVLTGPPGPPGTPTVMVNGNQATFAWTAPTSGAPPTEYNLIGRFSPGGPVIAYLPVAPGLNPLTVSVPDGTYSVTVQGVNASGAGPESGPMTLVVPQIPAPPGAPMALATAVNGIEANFAWSPPASGGPPATYTLSASRSPGGAIFVQLSLPAYSGATPVTSYRVSPVAPGTYYVRLSASNAGGSSAFSNEVTVIVAPPGPPVLGAASVFQRTVTLSWSAPATGPVPTMYLITARLLPNGAGPAIASLTQETTTLTVTGVPPNTYYVTVQAMNAAGIGPKSNEIVVTVS